MRKLLTVSALAATLGLAACQTPDGRLDVGNTLLLGAGVAAVAGVAASASQPSYRYASNGYGYGYRQPSYGYGYGNPYGYRRW